MKSDNPIASTLSARYGYMASHIQKTEVLLDTKHFHIRFKFIMLIIQHEVLRFCQSHCQESHFFLL